MKISSLKSLYLAELEALASMEGQLADALQRMGQAASNPKLRDALLRHREETVQQGQRLDPMLKSRGAGTNVRTDQSVQGLIRESERILGTLEGKELRDVGVISFVQRLMHYEISVYGTVAALAGELAFRDDQQILHKTLKDEKSFDDQLSAIAKKEINPAAAALA
jgi:ferritin-like metal-binding protein YciE